MGSSCKGVLLLFSPTCCLLLQLLLKPSFPVAKAYENYTVGGSYGWYDDLMQPKADYQKWAADKTFSLGDFLIFNTDRNHSVVQTYNETTYSRCDYDDAETDDTAEWSGEPAFDAAAITVPVPLLRVGPNFFFSGNYDGDQCRNGQHFAINVTRGQGLPSSLKGMSESPAPASLEAGGNVPHTIVPSNFDHPSDDNDVKATSSAVGKGFITGILVGVLVWFMGV